MAHEHGNLLVALAGQPNCGKSTIFNQLTGAKQHVANFPGVTVEKKQGTYRDGDHRIEVVDLPGTYSLTSYSQEERVARDFVLLERPEVLVCVVDASNLERHLYLAFQLREMRIPMVLCLNMVDVAKRRGITIDEKRLSAMLDMPVISTVGKNGVGIEKLREAINTTAATVNHDPGVWRLDYGPALEPVIEELTERLRQRPHLMEDFAPRWLAVKLMEEDEEAQRIVQHHTHDEAGGLLLQSINAVRKNFRAEQEHDAELLIAQRRYQYATEIVEACVTRSGKRLQTWTDRIDSLFCRPVIGLLFVAGIIYLTFMLTFQVADGWKWIPTENGFTTPSGVFGWFFDEALPGLADGLQEGPLKSLITDGILKGVGGVMIFVPIIFFMFLFLSLIEDIGIVARIAFILDRFLRPMGLSGHSVLPLIMSGGIAGGCAVPGVLSTRTMRDQGDRLTTMLVVPFMSCGAKVPVYTLLVSLFFGAYRGLVMMGLILLAWCFAFLAAFVLRKTIIPHEQGPFVLELSPYHPPMLKTALRTAWHRTWMYMKKAATVILGISILLWGLLYFPRLDHAPYAAAEKRAEDKLIRTAEATPFAPLFTADESAHTLHYLAEFEKAAEEHDPETLAALKSVSSERFLLAEALLSDKTEDREKAGNLRSAFQTYEENIRKISIEEKSMQRHQSFAGQLGRKIETITGIAGFDWRDNIALLGGVGAKEVIIMSWATAYGMEEDDALVDDAGKDDHPLAQTFRADPNWSPRRALAILLFIMLYAPCMPTLAVIRSESGSWKWAVFSLVYTTALAFIVATAVYQAAGWLGWGV